MPGWKVIYDLPAIQFQSFNPIPTIELPRPNIVIQAWHPRRVKSIIAPSNNSFVGLVDENTALKYPRYRLKCLRS